MRIRPIVLIPGLVTVLGISLAVLHSQQRSATAIESLAAAPTGSASPSPPAQPVQADPEQRRYPAVPADPIATATLLAEVETALRDPTTPPQQLPDLGHQQQVIYRVLSADVPRSQQVLAALPQRWRSVAERHLAARREFLRMSRGRRPSMLPAWRIIQPEPAEQLIAYYKKAEADTGIEWEVLAAVNLVETGMGRIDGVSVANAQGPMQFLPTTWAEAGIGKGDIRDPHDAIQAAARYLVRRGGLQDIRRGLWGYNNSDYYGKAVMLYASLIKEDPSAYTGLYHWEIHFNADAGDLWLPVGYIQRTPISVQEYLRRNPSSKAPE